MEQLQCSLDKERKRLEQEKLLHQRSLDNASKDIFSRLEVAREELRVIEEAKAQAQQFVVLNVGGGRFETTRSTLTAVEGSALAKLFSGHSLTKASDAPFFIDRDPTHFQLVLNFLRSCNASATFGNPGSRFVLPDDVQLRRELAEEANYFGLDALARICAAPDGNVDDDAAASVPNIPTDESPKTEDFVDDERSAVCFKDRYKTGVRAFSFGDFTDFNFDGMHLQDCVFSHCIMQRAVFNGSTLERCSFNFCDLTAGQFHRVNIRDTTFETSTLCGIQGEVRKVCFGSVGRLFACCNRNGRSSPSMEFYIVAREVRRHGSDELVGELDFVHARQLGTWYGNCAIIVNQSARTPHSTQKLVSITSGEKVDYQAGCYPRGLNTFKPIKPIFTKGSICMSDDDSLVALIDDTRSKIEVSRTDTGKVMCTISTTKDYPCAVYDFTSDGKLLLIQLMGNVCCVETATGKVSAIEDSKMWHGRFCANDQFIWVKRGKLVRLYETSTLELVRTLPSSIGYFVKWGGSDFVVDNNKMYQLM